MSTKVSLQQVHAVICEDHGIVFARPIADGKKEVEAFLKSHQDAHDISDQNADSIIERAARTRQIASRLGSTTTCQSPADVEGCTGGRDVIVRLNGSIGGMPNGLITCRPCGYYWSERVSSTSDYDATQKYRDDLLIEVVAVAVQEDADVHQA